MKLRNLPNDPLLNMDDLVVIIRPSDALVPERLVSVETFATLIGSGGGAITKMTFAEMNALNATVDKPPHGTLVHVTDAPFNEYVLFQYVADPLNFDYWQVVSQAASPTILAANLNMYVACDRLDVSFSDTLYHTLQARNSISLGWFAIRGFMTDIAANRPATLTIENARFKASDTGAWSIWHDGEWHNLNYV